MSCQRKKNKNNVGKKQFQLILKVLNMKELTVKVS